MKNKFQKIAAFLLAVIMAMTLNLPSGTSGIFDLVKTAFAADSITYTALEGTSGTNTSQSYGKLVDGDTSTKWCVSNFSSAYIIFKSSEAGYVKGYTMTTGNDTATQTSRNPEDWTLYGCNDYTSSGTGTWEIIHQVTGDEVLQNVNTTSFAFTCDQTAIPYQYFKLEITKNSGTEKYMQLSEFALDIVSSEITPSQPTGDGSADNPYKIGTASELYWFADKVNNDNANYKSANAVLTDDIIVNQNVLKDDDTLADNSSLFTSWTPIGNNSNKYSGTFDGKGYTVSGLYFNDTSINFVGLFGYNNNGTIKNVGIADSYIKGNNYVGDVCGYNYGGTITNSYNTGTVSGGGYFVGGVCGYNYSATVTNCYNTGKVSDASSIGGVCGYNNGTITNSYNTGAVSGSGSKIGSVCGENHRTITNCYYLADTEDENGGKTTAQFESGEVAYLLQSAQTAVDGTIPEVWGQTIGTENYPVLGGKKVYRNEIYTSCAGNKGEAAYYYSNTKEKPVYEEVSLTYTAKEGTKGTSDKENYNKLIDGDIDTKWCVTSFSSAYVVFQSSEVGYVKGYTMTTGNDTETNAGRNPEDWTLYGCNDYTSSGTGTWEVIHKVTGDEVLQAVNKTSFDFTFGQTENSYQYFKLEITKNSGTETVMQLSEFALNLVPACTHKLVYLSSTNPDCVNPGYKNYICSICGEEKKILVAPLGHSFDSDRICTTCGVSEISVSQPENGDGSVDNPYQIAHYGNLVWFQQYVDSGNYSANAVLIADITANKNLLNDNGEVSGTPEYTWTPIQIPTSTPSYIGIFDGKGHTISGLYAPSSGQYTAFFARVNGTVKNLFITDSYFGTSAPNCFNSASVVGIGYDSSVIENCGSDSVVEGYSHCGGIVGEIKGKIINCYYAGKISADTDYSSAIASEYHIKGTITNCYYLDTCGLSSTLATAKTADEFASGEVCYLLNNGVINGTQKWYQTIGTDTLPQFEGRIVDYNGTEYFNHCDVHQWGDTPTSTVEPTCTEDGYDIYTCTVCGLTKNVANGKTAEHKWGEAPTSTVEPTCTEDGYDIYTCTVCGLTKNVANGKTAEHKWGEAPTSTVEPTCTEDGYDIYTCTVCGLTKNVANGKTAEHKWGEAPTSIVEPTCTEDGYAIYTCTVCGLTKKVDNGTATGHKWSELPTSVVEPTCTEDGYDVYTCTACGETKNVANGTTALGGHSYDDGVCTVCGEFTAAQPKNGDGSVYDPYQIANYGHLMWFQQFVDSGNYSTSAVLTADIMANENLLNDSGELSGTPKYTWTPITRNGSSSTTCYIGVFDGQGHTISGVYAPSSENCGLFGWLDGTIKNLLITDSYFGGARCNYVGPFTGRSLSDCVIENCGSDAVVVGSKGCGGIAGQLLGNVTNCYFAGKFNAGTDSSDAIAKCAFGKGAVTNCYYLDTCGLTSTSATSMTETQFASGEVCYKLNSGVTDGTQAWYQTIGTDTLPQLEGKTVFYSEAASPQYFNAVLGDVSSNEVIDKADAALVLKYAGGIGTLSAEQLTVADYNGDGTVDMLDAVEILGLAG